MCRGLHRVCLLFGFLAVLAMSTVGSVAEAAAPKSQFEKAKIKASIAYKKALSKSLDASVLPDKDVQEEAAQAQREWERALDAAVELDPNVRRTRREVERLKQIPEDDRKPGQLEAATEGLQFLRQNVEARISGEISDAHYQSLQGNDDISAPVEPVGSYNVEALAYLGGVWTQSFSEHFDTGVIGGRTSAGFMLPGRVRLQFDLEGERTGSYCSGCGGRSELTFGAHIDWRVAMNTDAGLFAGAQSATPPFHAQTSTNYFFGTEVRYFGRGWMAGLQAGRFDVSDGPGTLTDAWFVEGRAKFAIGRTFQIPGLSNLVLGASLGHASGTLSTTSLWATSTQWSVTLGQKLFNTPVTGFVGFHHYDNRVEGLGTVWNENIIKGGVKVDLSSMPNAPGTLERNVPLPYILRTMTTF